MINIRPIPAFEDNYIWLFTRPGSADACVVDPGDAAPVEAALARKGLNLVSILVTHHHYDHTGGLARLRERYAPLVYGPDNPAIDGIDRRLSAGDNVSVLGAEFRVIEVPGHTLDHIAYYHAGEPPVVFCGDTLFAAGCGRLFEGTAEVMHASLQQLAKLPRQTRVYCAHEYTLANLAFARAADPDNPALLARTESAELTRSRGEPTVPSTIGEELDTNPFLRCDSGALTSTLRQNGRLHAPAPSAAEVFAAVRRWKDTF